MDYWHAGPNGIPIGERIIPAAQLPALPLAYGSSEYDTDPDRVYLTTDRDMAMAYASQFNFRPDGGTLYRVRPIGDIAEDPDYPDLNIAWTADAAEVLAIEAHHVNVGVHQHVRATGRYQTWETGAGSHLPMYDKHGHMLPSPQMLAAGFDADTLKALGRWIPLEYVEMILAHSQQTGTPPTRSHVEQLIANS